MTTMLLDAASLYFRAFYGVPTSVTTPDGRPINAVRGFLDMTARLLTAHGPALRRHLVSDVVPVDEGPSVLLGLARRERPAGQVVFTFPG